MSEDQPITHDGDLFEMVNGLYYGYAKTQTVDKRQPLLHWQGEKIPWDLYCQWATFMQWAYNLHKSEAQVSLVYNEKHKLWNTLVYPQEVSAASTDEIKTGDMTLYEEPLVRGFEMAGSLHSHARMKAFQSGTDSHNELDRSGLHITLGSFDEDALTFHARMSFRGYQYHKVFIEEWIEFPPAIQDLPDELKDTCRQYYLVHPSVVEFPPEWKDRVQEKTHPAVTYAGRPIAGYTAPPKQQPLKAPLKLADSDEITELLTYEQEVLFDEMNSFGMNASEVTTAARKAWNVAMQAETVATLETQEDKDEWIVRILTAQETSMLEIMRDYNVTAENLGQDAEVVEKAMVMSMVAEGGQSDG